MPVEIIVRDREHTGRATVPEDGHFPVTLHRLRLTQQMTVVFGNGHLTECQKPPFKKWQGQGKLLLHSDQETVLGQTPEGYTVSVRRFRIKAKEE